jgi:hypothetical protein
VFSPNVAGKAGKASGTMLLKRFCAATAVMFAAIAFEVQVLSSAPISTGAVSIPRRSPQKRPYVITSKQAAGVSQNKKLAAASLNTATCRASIVRNRAL